MLLYFLAQAVIAVSNISSVLLTRNGKSVGWIFLGVSQTTFIVYSIITGQYVLIAMNIFMLGLAIDTWMRWNNVGGFKPNKPLDKTA